MNERDIRRRTLRDGSYQITCRKHLWQVLAPTMEQAVREARHYWIQYHADGEYDQ